MTYRNNFEVIPMATLAEEQPTVATTTQEVKRNISLTTVQKWVVAGILAAILLPMLVYLAGYCGVVVLASLFDGGLFSTNGILTVLGSAALAALLVYGIYRIGHKEPDRKTSTNPAWAFKYAKVTVLVHGLALFASTKVVEYLPVLTNILTMRFPGVINTFLYEVNAPLLLIVVGVLLPIGYELVVSNLAHRELKKDVNGFVGYMVHLALFILAFAVLGGNTIAGVLLACLAVHAFSKYNHATYPVAILVTSSVLTVLTMTGVVMGAKFYVITYVVLSVLHRVLRFLVNEFSN